MNEEFEERVSMGQTGSISGYMEKIGSNILLLTAGLAHFFR